MLQTRTSTCRKCMAFCPIEVTLEDGRPIKVEGNRRAPLYGGFICPKGRTLPQLHAQPGRLMHSLKRHADGEYRPIPIDDAIDEIAERLRVIIDRHGPRAVAAFIGSAIISPGWSSVAIENIIGEPIVSKQY